MPKLRLDEAPAALLPLRFLLAMPCWGVAGGVLLLIDGATPLYARWHPATMALVHAWTLGVLGNAMFGSLLQFLPVAAGVELRWRRGAPWLHAVFNLGALLLVIGLHGNVHLLLLVAGTLLPLAFLWLAAMTLPGLCAAAGERLLRAGMAAALACGVATALVGGVLALLLAGGAAWPPAAVDVHAAFGVLGWMVLLFAGAWHLAHRNDVLLPVLVAFGGAGFALAVLALQWPVPKGRRHALFLQWRAGASALALAAPALLAGQGMLAGVLALAVGLPLLVGAMAMEIVPFVAWIGLRHRVPRGVRIPGVQRLLPDARKRRVLLAQALAAPLLVLALLWPQAWLARLAGAAQCVAWTVHGHALLGALHGARAFARSVEKAV